MQLIVITLSISNIVGSEDKKWIILDSATCKDLCATNSKININLCSFISADFLNDSEWVKYKIME